MSTGWKWNKFAGALVVSAAVLCLASVSPVQAKAQHGQKKAAKKPQLPPLPSGPTSQLQPIPLDSIAAVPPQVSYQNNELTIVAPNSTLADILRAVRKQTGADIEVPAAPERVVTHLGPGPAREIVAELLNGSRFNYVLLGSPNDDTALTRVVLVAKSGPDTITPNPAAPQPNPAVTQVNNVPPPQPEVQPDMPDAEPADDNANNADDAAADQAAQEAEQQPNPNPDQPGVKTPQQMLQEMQQRQMQLQQQQPPGQPPIPGSGMPPHPPQEP